MKTLVWGATFKRAYKQVTHRNPELQQKVEHTLQQLVEECSIRSTLNMPGLKSENGCLNKKTPS
jgi:hypothetical protein